MSETQESIRSRAINISLNPVIKSHQAPEADSAGYTLEQLQQDANFRTSGDASLAKAKATATRTFEALQRGDLTDVQELANQEGNWIDTGLSALKRALQVADGLQNPIVGALYVVEGIITARAEARKAGNKEKIIIQGEFSSVNESKSFDGIKVELLPEADIQNALGWLDDIVVGKTETGIKRLPIVIKNPQPPGSADFAPPSSAVSMPSIGKMTTDRQRAKRLALKEALEQSLAHESALTIDPRKYYMPSSGSASKFPWKVLSFFGINDHVGRMNLSPDDRKVFLPYSIKELGFHQAQMAKLSDRKNPLGTKKHRIRKDATRAKYINFAKSLRTKMEASGFLNASGNSRSMGHKMMIYGLNLSAPVKSYLLNIYRSNPAIANPKKEQDIGLIDIVDKLISDLENDEYRGGYYHPATLHFLALLNNNWVKTHLNSLV